MTDYEVESLIAEGAIARRTQDLAADISAAFAGTDQLLLVGLLRGSFIFIADLARQLDLPCEVDFMVVSSYGSEMESSGNVRVLKDLDTEIAGRDVLIVEDIVDTGRTLSKVLEFLKTRGPRRIEVCTLLNKPSRREAELDVRWIGFDVGDEFVVGYGIDYAQRNRTLPYIGVVKPKVVGP